jgi:hypothetical protein
MGPKLVRRKRVGATILLVAALAACKSEVKKAADRAAPQVRATVVTIQTTLQPEKKTFTHTIAIAGDRARSMGDTDQWRLFDLKTNTVTFVDDITKTYHIEPLQALIAEHQRALEQPLPGGTPRAVMTATHETKPLQGTNATRWTIRVGGYTRDLWIGAPPPIPPQLFAMMTASDVPSSTLAPMMKSVDAALLAMRGFPLADHAELPYGNRKIVIDRTVVNIETQNVPASTFNVPAGFKAPDASRRRAS